MSGRAGRRGKDDRGICVTMIDEKASLGSLMLELSLFFLINFIEDDNHASRFGMPF